VPEKVRMKLTLTTFYDADPKNYGDYADNPEGMAELDEQGWSQCPDEAVHFNDEWEVRVEPCKVDW
jgi:hypothetical protein